MLWALAFLKTDDVAKAFYTIYETVKSGGMEFQDKHDAVVQFLEYIESTWVGKYEPTDDGLYEQVTLPK